MKVQNITFVPSLPIAAHSVHTATSVHSWAQQKLSPLSPLSPLNILLTINGSLLS